MTKSNAYPLPWIHDCKDQLGKVKYVSAFDLLKGYWQVPLTERARKISAFTTPIGLYRYKQLAFGLKNAPASFQRLMNNVKRGLKNTRVYIDAVVVSVKHGSTI